MRNFAKSMRNFADLLKTTLNFKKYLRFSNEATKTGAKYDHETVKPETLTRALILTCSRKNDLVLIPFSGSGTSNGNKRREKR